MKTGLLLADVGNTRIKWSATTPDRSKLFFLARDGATAQWGPEQVRELARAFPQSTLILACVVPRLVPAFKKAFSGRIKVVDGDLAGMGLSFNYPKPGEIGADRIAAAVAAREEGIFPAIIIACGTATAYTVLDAKGRLCGGAIAPGLQAQLDALVGATAQLPSTTLRRPRRALAKSTLDAIRAGVLLSFQGGVKETVARLAESLPSEKKAHLILTGGHAEIAAQALGGKATLRPLLVLEGLRIIGARLLGAAE